MIKSPVEIKLLSDKAILPTQNASWDAWYDVYSVESYQLKPWERKLFPTNIAITAPLWYYFRVAPRSWLAYKKWIDVMAGVIDHSYKWDVWVILINLWNEIFEVNEWDRIAQLILTPCLWVEWNVVKELSSVDRWGGFWSSGWVKNV